MGNMSNPSVNRWGINTFWYKFWYSDVSYALNMSQDSIFTKLIHIYLYYGLNNFKNIFFNSYWFFTSNPKVDLTPYHRIIPAKPTAFGVNPEYRLRFTTHDIYPMKIWILRYGGWFIFNFYWFQPLKTKKFRAKKKRLQQLDQFRVIHRPHATTLRRLKTLLSYSFLKNIRSKKVYLF